MIKWIEKKLKQTTKELLLAFCFKSKQIKQAYISKHNLEYENRVLFFKITNSEIWH